MALQVGVRDIEHDDWPRVVESFEDHNYENCLTYTLAHSQRLGTRARLVAVTGDEKLIGAAVVRLKPVPLTGCSIAYVSSGPLFRPKGLTGRVEGNLDVVVKAVDSHVGGGGRNLFLMRLPIWGGNDLAAAGNVIAAQGFVQTDLVRSYKTILIDLLPDEAKLRSGLHSKWRNMLTQSQKNGMSIVEGSAAEGWQRFQGLYDSMRELKEFDGGLGPQFFAPLDVNDAGLVFLFAQKDGVDVGSLIVSALGDTAVYLFGATNGMGRDLRAGYLLQWAALAYFKAKGIRWYDLGGIDEATNAGGFQFKARMGGRIVDALGPYKKVPRGIRGALIDKAVEFKKSRKR